MLRSNAARKSSFSSGRGWNLVGRRPSVSDSNVPGRSDAAPTSDATRAASPPPTPARCNVPASVSPSPSAAVSSICGRSGVSLSGRTSAPAAIRRPVVAPSASGANDCVRASSNAASPITGALAPISGRKPGDSNHAPAHKAVQVASPRHHVRLPISRPRSGTQSVSRAAARARCSHARSSDGRTIRPDAPAPAHSSPCCSRKNTPASAPLSKSTPPERPASGAALWT